MDTPDHLNKTEESQAFAAGQAIFREGEPGDVLYIVAEGEVEIFMGGKRLETLEAGDILGEMALIEDRPRSASAFARTDCLLTLITRPHFLTLVQRTPLFAIQVMRVLAKRLRHTNQQKMS